MFQMPMSSPMMTTMFGFAAGACASAGAETPNAAAPAAISVNNKSFSFISALHSVDRISNAAGAARIGANTFPRRRPAKTVHDSRFWRCQPNPGPVSICPGRQRALTAISVPGSCPVRGRANRISHIASAAAKPVSRATSPPSFRRGHRVREEPLESGAEIVEPRLAVGRAQQAVLRAFAPAIAAGIRTAGSTPAASPTSRSRTSPASARTPCRRATAPGCCPAGTPG